MFDLLRIEGCVLHFSEQKHFSNKHPDLLIVLSIQMKIHKKTAKPEKGFAVLGLKNI